MNTSRVVVKGGQTRQARRLRHERLARLLRAQAADLIDDDTRVPLADLRRLKTEARRKTT
jgi:hypothetical protein